MLIRVESEWHLDDIVDGLKWQHWIIEKNILSINIENLDYEYELPDGYTDPFLEGLIPISIVGIVSIVVLIVILGKKSKNM